MRDNKIDILRFIGLAMIIFAHVGPPGILFQLRNFDVPLMVLVAGMSFGLSYKASEPFAHYLWKRLKRLVLPVWVFLTGYFIVKLFLHPESRELGAYSIFTSYSLLGGIGYVWIIRVFLLVALVSPFIYLYNQKTVSHARFFMILAVSFAIFELLRYLSLPYIQTGAGMYLSLITHYTIPYALIFALGLRISALDNRQILLLAFFNLGVLLLAAVALFVANDRIVLTQKMKYPPSIYYLTYAVFVSLLLWLFSPQMEKLLDKLKLTSLVLFIAQNSIWIYLWHVPFIKVVQTNFLLKYIILFSVATAIVFVQVWIVNNVLVPRVGQKAGKNLRIMLTG